MNESTFFQREPDFVLVGGWMPDGNYMMVGSRDLTDAELRMNYDPPPDVFLNARARSHQVNRTTRLEVGLRRFIMAPGTTQMEALQRVTQALADGQVPGPPAIGSAPATPPGGQRSHSDVPPAISAP